MWRLYVFIVPLWVWIFVSVRLHISALRYTGNMSSRSVISYRPWQHWYKLMWFLKSVILWCQWFSYVVTYEAFTFPSATNNNTSWWRKGKGSNCDSIEVFPKYIYTGDITKGWRQLNEGEIITEQCCLIFRTISTWRISCFSTTDLILSDSLLCVSAVSLSNLSPCTVTAAAFSVTIHFKSVDMLPK